MKLLISDKIRYIGSHTAVELIEHVYSVVIIDNLCNGSIDVLNNVKDAWEFEKNL